MKIRLRGSKADHRVVLHLRLRNIKELSAFKKFPPYFSLLIDTNKIEKREKNK